MPVFSRPLRQGLLAPIPACGIAVDVDARRLIYGYTNNWIEIAALDRGRHSESPANSCPGTWTQWSGVEQRSIEMVGSLLFGGVHDALCDGRASSLDGGILLASPLVFWLCSLMAS